jgi:hypothetical protein
MENLMGWARVAMSDFEVGDNVVLLRAPEWLLRDLPREEQDEILFFVGRLA